MKKAILLLVLTTICLAQVPRTMNYQGKLTDPDGVAITGTHEVEFKIYDSEIGGTILWSETHSTVSLSHGLFDVLLGSVTPIELPFDEQYWVELVVEGETMTPRQPLTSVPYARRAVWADSVEGGSVISFIDSVSFIDSISYIDSIAHIDSVHWIDSVDYIDFISFIDSIGYIDSIGWVGHTAFADSAGRLVNALTPGEGITGDPFDGSVPRTWTVEGGVGGVTSLNTRTGDLNIIGEGAITVTDADPNIKVGLILDPGDCTGFVDLHDGGATNQNVPVKVQAFNPTVGQFLLTNAEIGCTGGRIRAITFYSDVTSGTIEDVDVFMDNVLFSDLDDRDPFFGEEVVTGVDLTVSGDGSVEITLDHGFFYDGDNLLITVRKNASTGAMLSWYGEATGAVMARYDDTSSDYPLPSEASFAPHVLLDFFPPEMPDVVTSANDLTGDVRWVGSDDITVTTGGDSIMVEYTGVAAGDDWGDDTVNTDATLTGSGTPTNILGIAPQGADTGQVLKWTGATWTPDDIVSTTYPSDTVIYSTPRLTGIGTSGNPLDIAQQGAGTGQVLKWDGGAWTAADDDTGTGGGGTGDCDTCNYADTAGVALYADSAGAVAWEDISGVPADISDGDDIDTNIAHWGDIRDIPPIIEDTIPLGKGLSLGADDSINVNVRDGLEIADDSLQLAQQGAATGQVLKWDGSAWAPAEDEIGSSGSGAEVYEHWENIGRGGKTIVKLQIPEDGTPVSLWLWGTQIADSAGAVYAGQHSHGSHTHNITIMRWQPVSTCVNTNYIMGSSDPYCGTNVVSAPIHSTAIGNGPSTIEYDAVPTTVVVWLDGIEITDLIGGPFGSGIEWSTGEIDLSSISPWFEGEHTLEFCETGGTGGRLGYLVKVGVSGGGGGSYTGDITSVEAGAGLSGGGLSGAVTIDITPGDGISIIGDAVTADLGTSIDGSEIENGSVEWVNLADAIKDTIHAQSGMKFLSSSEDISGGESKSISVPTGATMAILHLTGLRSTTELFESITLWLPTPNVRVHLYCGLSNSYVDISWATGPNRILLDATGASVIDNIIYQVAFYR